MEEIASILRRDKAIEILGALTDADRHVRELQVLVGGSATTIDTRIREFLKAGLVATKGQKTWPFRRTVSLTPLGRQAAKLYLGVESLLVSPIASKSPVSKSRGQQLILALMSRVGGEVRGSTRLQKYLFLLSKAIESRAPFPYTFHPYHYGPYDPNILIDAESLRRQGLLELDYEVFPDEQSDGDLIVRRSYKLTPQGEGLAEKLWSSLPLGERKAIDSVKEFESMRLEELLTFVYNNYPKESKSAFPKPA